MKTRAEMIDWLAHEYSDGYDYTLSDGRVKDNEKATIKEYWVWHDILVKLSTARLKKRIAMRVINKAV